MPGILSDLLLRLGDHKVEPTREDCPIPNSLTIFGYIVTPSTTSTLCLSERVRSSRAFHNFLSNLQQKPRTRLPVLGSFFYSPCLFLSVVCLNSSPKYCIYIFSSCHPFQETWETLEGLNFQFSGRSPQSLAGATTILLSVS